MVWSDCRHRHNCEELMLNLYYDCFKNVLLCGIISLRGNKLKSIEHNNLFYRKKSSDVQLCNWLIFREKIKITFIQIINITLTITLKCCVETLWTPHKGRLYAWGESYLLVRIINVITKLGYKLIYL